MKHTIGDLIQMQSLPLEEKIIMSKNRIKAWYEHYDGEVYVSFSGGKDSTVLKHLVDSVYSDVPAVFVNTGLEFPEVRQFAIKQKNVEIIYPKMKFYEVIEQYGYPVVSKEQSYFIYSCRNTKSEYTRQVHLYGRHGTKSGKISEKWKFLLDAPFKISNRCCEKLKKEPCKRYEKETGRKPFIGMMATESRIRTQVWLKNGCNAFEANRPMSTPLSFWTEQDVLQYVVNNDLEIASVYGNIYEDENGELQLSGEKRTGCMFCMYGTHLEPYPNKFQRMQHTHPKQWDYCINKLGCKDVLEFMGIPYEDNQLNLFDK